VRKLPAAALVSMIAVNARACAVCFGAPGSALNRGFFWAILLLLVLPFLLMGSLVALVVYHIRKGQRPTHPLPQ
jgi:hypothetical protein